MEEIEKTENAVSEETSAPKSKFRLWFENFWYHYKWHSIAAIFVIVTTVIISMQMCTRTDFDIHITYAGDYEIAKVSSGSTSPYGEAVKSLSKVGEDFNKDGEINVNFINLFVVNEKEKEELLAGSSNLEINESLVREDTSTLRSSITYGDNYIFFLSERLFLEYEDEFEGEGFISLTPYIKEGKEYEYANDAKTGIYLRSLGLKRLPTISDLPEDTVVCMRTLNPVSSVFGKKQNEENYKRSEEVMKNILSFE